MLTLSRKKSSSSSASSIASFEVLVRKVKETFLEGNDRLRQEMVKTYWQTGKYIHEHILENQHRAEYGEKVIPRLSERLKMSERSLREILQVYRRIPEIRRSCAELDWSHLRTLASISDEDLRQTFAKRAVEGNWTSEFLRTKIKTELRSSGKKNLEERNEKLKINESQISNLQLQTSQELIVRPKLGTLYTYRLVKTVSGETKIDQGFSIYRSEFDRREKLKTNDIVESKKNKDGSYAAVKSKRESEDLFTYIAYVERVIDGDTLFVEIDLGFHESTRQYLRLRGLDSPELDTAEGKRAKSFVEKLIHGKASFVKSEAPSKNASRDTFHASPFVFITSTRSDKYDRYLADVFIPNKEFMKQWNSGTAVLKESSSLIYLNNELLKNKLAVRMRY